MAAWSPTSGSSHDERGRSAGRTSFTDPVLESLGWLLIASACQRPRAPLTLRIWVVGCGTGELAYGAAMTGHDALATVAPHATLQVFATDDDEAAIEVAREGLYSADRLRGLDEGKRARYFVERQGAYQARDCIRKMCLFSRHDLFRDPAVPGIDALVCRSELQDSLPWERERSYEAAPLSLQDAEWVVLRPAVGHPVPPRFFESSSESDERASRRRNPSARRARYLSQITQRRGSQARLEADIGALERSNDALRQANAELTRKNDQQAAVARLGLRALWGASLDALYQEALAALDRTMGTPVGVIFEYLAHEQLLCVRHTTAASALSWGRGPVPAAGSGHLTEALAATFPVFTGGAHLDDVQPPARMDRTSGVACSIRDDVTVYGVLAAYTTDERAFTREDAHFVQSVANVLAGAAGRDRRRKRLYLEHGVMSVLAEADSVSAIAVRIAPTLGEALDAEVIELWVPNRADPSAPLELLARQFAGVREPERCVCPLDAELAQSVLDSGWPLWHPAPGDASSGAMLLAFPLFVGPTPMGVIQCAGRSGLHVDDELVRGLLRVGHAIGESMHRLQISDALHESEQRLRAQTAELESVYATLPAGLTLYDRSMRLLRVNQRMSELLSDLAPMGSPSEQHQLDLCQEYMRRVLETGEVIRDVELSSITQEGERRWWLWSFAPVMESPEEVRAASAIVQDITDLKRAEASLREAARQKDEFLAMLGHELRNPLAAIRNATDLLGLMIPETPQISRIRSVLERQTEHTAKLIDGLLDVSRIIQGKLRVELQTIDVVRIIRELTEDRAEQLAERGIRLELDLPSAPVWIRADRVRIVQVLDNLLVNATKFTSRGGRIGVEIQEQEEKTRIAVWDTGAGIDEAALPHIFEPFRQATQTLDRCQGGLGLGLALVKGLIELHGGSIRVESRVGKGSRFEVALLAAAAPEAPRSQPPPSPPALRVLLVEDNVDAAEMLGQLLHLKGHLVDTAQSGEAGLAQARVFRPHVLVCDIGLPGDMDGYDVARAFRSDPELRRVGLVAITGYGSSTDRARASDAGFDSCFVKPLDFASLERELSRIVRDRDQEP